MKYLVSFEFGEIQADDAEAAARIALEQIRNWDSEATFTVEPADHSEQPQIIVL